MCNTQKKPTDSQQEGDYRFLDYRLNQYEAKLDKGLEKIEKTQHDNYTELQKSLTIMQQGITEQNKTLIELTQRQQAVEQKIQCVDKLKEVATKHAENIRTLEGRLNIYKQIIFVVGTGVLISLGVEIIKFI